MSVAFNRNVVITGQGNGTSSTNLFYRYTKRERAFDVPLIDADYLEDVEAALAEVEDRPARKFVANKGIFE